MLPNRTPPPHTHTPHDLCPPYKFKCPPDGGALAQALNTCRMEGSICCSKTFIYHSAFIVPSKTWTLPIPYALMHPHIIRDSGFWTELWWHAGRSPSSLARRTRRPWFPTRMSNLDSSNHRTLFHFETVHFKWALVHRTQWRFWTMFTFGFLFCMIEL